MSDPVVSLNVSEDERFILRAGLLLWIHVDEPSETLMIAMGFADRSDFFESRPRIGAALRESEPLALKDWETALAATEMIFVSDRWKGSKPWRQRTAFSDEMTIDLLRSIQRLIAETHAEIALTKSAGQPLDAEHSHDEEQV